jgi:hypothetical protein
MTASIADWEDPFAQVEAIESRKDALLFLQFAEAMRRLVAGPLDAWPTPQELVNGCRDPQLVELLEAMRHLVADPGRQLDSVIAMDVHIARMRGRWRIPEHPRRGRPLTAETERIASEIAAREVENSTRPVTELARENRRQSRLNVEAHRYRWAGLWRRVAEIQEARFSS